MASRKPHQQLQIQESPDESGVEEKTVSRNPKIENRTALIDALIKAGYATAATRADWAFQLSAIEEVGFSIQPRTSSLTPDQVSDPGRFFCPHCGAFRPGYGFNYQRHVLPGIGVVGYFIIFCSAEDCRKIVSTALIEFVPDPGAAAAAQREGPRIIS